MILEAEHIAKSYRTGDGRLEVLKDVNLQISEGEMVSIIGPSGCGKSTLLNILGTLDRPESGKLWIDGKDILSLNDEQISGIRNTIIGFVFQFHHLLPEFTLTENLVIPQMIGGISKEDAIVKSISLLSKVGLEERKDHKPAQISGGERQKVAVIRALVNNPKLVLADEPTGNLDIRSGNMILDLMSSLNKEFGHTYLIVTHNPVVADRCMNHYELLDGKLITIE